MIHGRLLPVIPRSTEGEDKGAPPTVENVVRLLTQYGDSLADAVVCFEPSVAIVEAILAAGKKVVPCIVGDREEVTLQWECSPDTEWRAWVGWVLENAARFEAVQLGNVILEVTNQYTGEPVPNVVRRILNKFPTLIGRLTLAPFHNHVAEDMATEGWPLRRALREAGPWFTLYWGYEFLTDCPPKAADWLYEMTAYSGVNYAAGAKEHNLNKLTQIGFTGGLFFLPAHSHHKVADALMRDYLTDVT